MLAVALITGSCSNNLDEGQTPAVNSGGHIIKFDSWTNKSLRAATKANDVTDFAVLATDISTGATDPVLINGRIVTGSNASGWTYSPPAFWPETVTVNFFAFSPVATMGVTGGATALAGQNDANPNEPTIEYTLPTALADRKDLLVARHSGTYAAEGSSGVALNFRHALSRIL